MLVILSRSRQPVTVEKDFIKTGPWPCPLDSWDKQYVVDAAMPFIYMVHIYLKNRPQVQCGTNGIPFAHKRGWCSSFHKERERGAAVRSELNEKETHHETHTLSYCGSSP